MVLARKWRPMQFSDLVGQDHVAKTLGNAIDANRVAHAFLFTGVRGVGKTTSARILAKALNCMRPLGSLAAGAPDPGPTVAPCLQCSACKEIAEGRDVDVQEIDGASYNGVDEVRKLQDSLPYRPQRDRFKIVIVDEVHMLTSAAWNAFLKTLEEPPPHVKFIFATTEVHKVPITILSRVQRFDFKMIPTRLIIERLRWVLAQEDCRADDAALVILARQAAGSMRDAMSLLDQVIAFGGQELVGHDVARVLGVASRGALLDIARALLEGRGEDCLERVATLADQGFDIAHLTRDLLSLLRDLVVAKLCKDPSRLLDAPDDELAAILAIVEPATDQDLMRLYQGFSRGFDEVVRSIDPRAGLEMLLVRLAHRPALLPLDELLHRIGHLEKRLVQAGARRPTAHAGGGATRAPQMAPITKDPEQHATPRAHRPSSGGGNKDQADDEAGDAHLDALTDRFLPPPEQAGISPTPAENSPKANAQRTLDPQPASTPQPTVTPQPPSAPPRATIQLSEAAPPGSKGPAPTTEEQQRLSRMLEVMEHLRIRDAALAAYFEHTVPLVADGTTLKLGLEPSHIFEQQILDDSAKTLLSGILTELWGAAANLEIIRNCAAAKPHATASAERARRRAERQQDAILAVKNHPKVVEACRIFGAHIKSVQLPEGAA